MSWDPYLDLEHGVLRNRLGITDPAELAQAEADITLTQLAHLTLHPIEGNFDLAHLQAIHYELFSPIYGWAGQLRTVELGKGAQRFCPPAELRHRADRIFLGLAARDHLRGLDRAAYLDGITELLAGLLYLHVFREGNGRSLRAMLAQLSRPAGYRLHWADLDAQENRHASRAAYDNDLKPLRALLDRRLSTI